MTDRPDMPVTSAELLEQFRKDWKLPGVISSMQISLEPESFARLTLECEVTEADAMVFQRVFQEYVLTPRGPRTKELFGV